MYFGENIFLTAMFEKKNRKIKKSVLWRKYIIDRDSACWVASEMATHIGVLVNKKSVVGLGPKRSFRPVISCFYS